MLLVTALEIFGNNLEKDIFNEKNEVSIRSLNLGNAFTMINNYNSYNALVRVTNIDNEAWVSKNSDWNNRLNYMGSSDPYYPPYYDLEFVKDKYRRDAIWGLNGLTNGDNITFTTYNENYSPYSYGYQVFNKHNNAYSYSYCEALAGVAGVVGENHNTYYTAGYYGYRYCPYNAY